MIRSETQDVERKVLSILKILSESQEPIGATIINRRLKERGIDLSERTVRYHLKLTDERGLTRLVGRDGRLITTLGREELKNAMVSDKVGYALSRIELLAYRTYFDREKGSGAIPVNITFFQKSTFDKALKIMKPVFASGLCVSSLVGIADEGKQLGDIVVPRGRIGFATVCSIVLNGTLLKAGIPINSRFGGILQMRSRKPVRFVELIHYAGSSLDPSEVFIRARMTSVRDVVKTGDGKILANFREIPAPCIKTVESVVNNLKEAGIDGLLVMGAPSETVCEIPLDLNRVGMVLIGGLNPIAAVEESGIETENRSMSTLMDYRQLIKFTEV